MSTNNTTPDKSSSNNILEEQQKIIQDFTRALSLIPKTLFKFTIGSNADQYRKLLLELFKKPSFIEELKDAFEQGISKLSQEKKEKVQELLDTIKSEINNANKQLSTFAGIQAGNTGWTLASGMCSALPPCNYLVIFINILRQFNKVLILSAQTRVAGNQIVNNVTKNPNFKALKEPLSVAEESVKNILDKIDTQIDSKELGNNVAAVGKKITAEATNTMNKAVDLSKNAPIRPAAGGGQKKSKKSKKNTRYTKSKLRQHINIISRRTDKSIKQFLQRKKYKIHRTRKTKTY